MLCPHSTIKFKFEIYISMFIMKFGAVRGQHPTGPKKKNEQILQ
ncbi:hypothetical protein MNB_SV-10-1465 [hydrothermal vent metagenome]|uniref:Uncharacterized protein n=1 Tax=hydrothermal vent metagenome TaxID=652676 RepID=A0A1W1C9A8_9ZZZZ